METAKAKILIVDDNLNNLEMLLEMLKDNYKIIAATNGKKALEKAEAYTPPDLILLDVMMPDMDGYQVCERLKANPKTADIPVIFITALHNEEDEKKGLQLGAIDYIQKPFSPSIVKMRVANHIALVKAHKQLREQNQALLEMAKLKEDIERITHHDLKTPLNGILGCIQVLMMSHEMTRSEYERFFKMMENSGYQMLEMINLSLDLYKMETGTYQLSPYKIDLIPVLKKIQTENCSLIGCQQLHVEILLEKQVLKDDDNFHVQGEALLCYSLFANLIKNAIEAAPNQSTITIFLSADSPFATIKIRNQGEVSESIRAHFFEKYVSDKKHGTGLGTYSASLSAKTQHGSIKLDCSEVGATTLLVQLPLCETLSEHCNG